MSALFYANKVILQRLAQLRAIVSETNSYGNIPAEKAVWIFNLLQKGQHLFSVGQVMSYVNGGYVHQFFPVYCFYILFAHILQLFIYNHRRFLPFKSRRKATLKMKFSPFLRYDGLIVQYDRNNSDGCWHNSTGLSPLPAVWLGTGIRSRIRLSAAVLSAF